MILDRESLGLTKAWWSKGYASPVSIANNSKQDDSACKSTRSAVKPCALTLSFTFELAQLLVYYLDVARTKMRGTLLVICFATSLSMSQHNECNFMEQVIQHTKDFQICVCSNQVYINCTLNGANSATKIHSKKEELCYKRLAKLANTSDKRTCMCDRLKECHSEHQLALHKATCARKAVMKIYPILPKLRTLCCDLQNAMLKLWLRLEERVFLPLVKSISHDSLDTVLVSRRLRRTNWCTTFRTECLEVDSLIRKGCAIRNKPYRRHKRGIEDAHSNYKTDFEPFPTGEMI